MSAVPAELAAFRAASAEAARASPALDWLAAVRERALHRFEERGFPTPGEEDWRYTDLRPAAELAAARAGSQPAGDVGPLPEALATSLAGSNPLVLLDGRLVTGGPHGIAGLTVTSLGRAPAAARGGIAARIGGALESGNPFPADLNAALLRDGLVIEVAAGTVLAAPIHVACAATGAGIVQNAILLRLGRGSRATLIEHHLGCGESISTTVTDVVCEPGSALAYAKIQAESDTATHLAAQRIAVSEDARADLLHLDLGARIGRNDLRVDLDGAGAAVGAHGLFFADGERHLDNHTRIDHRAPRATSRELYRGVADGRGRGVFNGKVIVHAGAIGTDARLASQNLLLSPTAEIDTKPELEIYADDVRCSHGATTGQLDRNAIFYLRSRGIPEPQARRMLIASFVREITRELPAGPVDELVARLLAGRLPELGEVSERP